MRRRIIRTTEVQAGVARGGRARPLDTQRTEPQSISNWYGPASVADPKTSRAADSLEHRDRCGSQRNSSTAAEASWGAPP
jgi:hypothetical protein